MKPYNTEHLTDELVGQKLGWTDIKSWGGRGRRGLSPSSSGRHECLPMFTSRLGDIQRALEGQGVEWSINARYTYKKGVKAELFYVAQVGKGRIIVHERAAETLCLAFLVHCNPKLLQRFKP